MDCRPFFFKKFGMFHHRSTMRIGTDAVMFAQWVELKPDDYVLDIGTGSGLIPLILAQKGVKKVDAVELDEEAIKELKKLECDNLELIHNDILKTDISELCKGERIKVVANIPYYITSPIIAHLLGERYYPNGTRRSCKKSCCN